jgi:hypothetical protein
MNKPWNRRRIDRTLALDAIGRAEVREASAPPAPVRLETGTRITAVTEGGTAVEGVVGRVWQTFSDSQSGAFRVLCEPAVEDSSDETAAAAA